MAKILESPLGWFELFERAVREGDIEKECIARRELQRLGIVVFVDFRSPMVQQRNDSGAVAQPRASSLQETA